MVTNFLLDVHRILVLKCSMFTVRHLQSHRPLLCDLRELCAKKTHNPYLGPHSRPDHTSAHPANSHRMTFLAHPHHLTPTESHAYKNRGRVVSTSKTGKCATRTKTSNLNRIIGLHHDFWTPPGGGSTSRQIFWPYFEFRTSIFGSVKTASAKSPARSWGEPSPHPSGVLPAGLPSTRSTISLAGPHRQSTSTADCASIPRLAGSSSAGLAAKISAQKSEKSKPARANSKPPQNQSGRDRAALASPSPGWKTIVSRCEFLPSGYLAAQNRSSSSPARPYISAASGKARCSS